MGSVEQQLEIYRMGGIICVILLILSILLAVLLFFLFDIPTIFMLRTGRDKKLSLQKMAENNSKTDSLRKDVDMDYTTVDMVNDEQKELIGKAEDTSILEMAETKEQTSGSVEVLRQQTESEKAARKSSDDVYFRITENVAVIHTEESI